MYQRILLAYDGSIEGRTALREGALLARQCGARVMFLAVLPESPGLRMAESAHAGAASNQRDSFKAVFEEGLTRLRRLGLDPVAKMVIGDPAQEIAAFANSEQADLVVVSHRRQSIFARWWSGPSGAYLTDFLNCSLLIGRNTISDAEFDAELKQSSH